MSGSTETVECNNKSVDAGRPPIALFCSATGVGHVTPLLATALATARRCPSVEVLAFTAVREAEENRVGQFSGAEAPPANFHRHTRVLKDVDPVTMEGMIRFADVLCHEVAQLIEALGGNLRVIVHDSFARHASRLSRTVFAAVPTYLFMPSPSVTMFGMCCAVVKRMQAEETGFKLEGVKDAVYIPGVNGVLSVRKISAGLDLERHPDPTLHSLSDVFGRNLRGIIANDSAQSFPAVRALVSQFAEEFIKKLQSRRREELAQQERCPQLGTELEVDGDGLLRKGASPTDELIFTQAAEGFSVYNVQEALGESRASAATEMRDDPVIQWLETCEPRSVTVICFGTLYIPTETVLNELEAAAKELAGTDAHKFLYVTKCVETSKKFEDVPNVRVERWVPLLSVMSHPAARLLITHGGWNTLQENFYLSSSDRILPMVLVPLGSDQFVNAELVEKHFRAGVSALVCVEPTAERVRTPPLESSSRVDEEGMTTAQMPTTAEVRGPDVAEVPQAAVTANAEGRPVGRDKAAGVKTAQVKTADVAFLEREFEQNLSAVIDGLMDQSLFTKFITLKRSPEAFRYFNKHEWERIICDDAKIDAMRVPKNYDASKCGAFDEWLQDAGLVREAGSLVGKSN